MKKREAGTHARTHTHSAARFVVGILTYVDENARLLPSVVGITYLGINPIHAHTLTHLSKMYHLIIYTGGHNKFPTHGICYLEENIVLFFRTHTRTYTHTHTHTR